ncbi:MAG: endonuclease/exonuclease/phosphatase family protein, partial [Candidatus Lokiarchaeota archaeon]
MEIYNKYLSRYYSEITLLGIMLFFFFEQITKLVESIYLLNLIHTEVNENIAAILFLLTPLILLFFKKGLSKKAMIVLGEIMIITRVLQPFFETQIKMILTGIGVGCFLIFFPVYLQKKWQEGVEKGSLSLGISLGFGVALSILFRTLGSSLDLTLTFWFQWIGWILAVIAAILMINLLHPPRINTEAEKTSEFGKLGGKWKILALCIGIFSVFLLCYFAFSSPAVIVRWSEGNYIAITTIVILVITGFIFIVAAKPNLLNKIPPKGILLWNLIFVVMLVLTIGLNQIPFITIASYPYFAPETTVLNYIILYAMLVLSPIIFIDFVLLLRELFKSKPSTRKLGAGFFASACFSILIIFSAVFTTTWDYIPLIGPIFRDMIWLVFLIMGAFLVWPLLVVAKDSMIFSKITRTNKKVYKTIGAILIIATGTIIGSIVLELPHIRPDPSLTTLSLLTYNIQQGADDPGNMNFEGQRAVIERLNPDIIGLEESDTARIANGNNDFVRYVSETLGYYSYYGPKTVTGTFGIALLSRYPIINARTFYMECVEEQAATIWAQITVGGFLFNIFITHLGNYRNTTLGDDTQIIQQANILSVATGKMNTIMMGDFNFEPNTEQYNITVAEFYDAYVLVNSTNPSNAVVDTTQYGDRTIPEQRIDHIFLSSQLNESITSIRYTGGYASDHPAVYATLDLLSI